MPALRLTDDGLASGERLYADWAPAVETPVTLTLTPYFVWANRGEGEMSVWLRH